MPPMRRVPGTTSLYSAIKPSWRVRCTQRSARSLVALLHLLIIDLPVLGCSSLLFDAGSRLPFFAGSYLSTKSCTPAWLGHGFVTPLATSLVDRVIPATKGWLLVPWYSVQRRLSASGQLLMVLSMLDYVWNYTDVC